MYQVMFVIHVVSAILLLSYLAFPFLAGRAGSRSMAAGLHTMNRIGQYVLVFALLSGVYMVSRAEYSVPWQIVAVLLVLALFAVTGMMGRPLKRLREGDADAAAMRKVRAFGSVAAVCYILLIVIMYNPNLL